MKTCFLIVYLGLYLLFLNSCCSSPITPGIKEALSKSGKNREELFQIIRHYQNRQDTLKLKAALFLIENMTDKYYLSGYKLDEYTNFIDSIYQIKKDVYDEKECYREFIQKSAYQRLPLDTLYDLENISASYLKYIIDETFLLWKKPWARHLTFEEFCELILPYRVGNEYPEKWHRLYQQKFKKCINPDIQSAIEACTAVNNSLIQYPIHIVHNTVRSADMNPSTLINMKFGLCEDYAQLAVYAMRAQGIPCAIETIPAFGKGRSKHTFNVVYNNDHKYYNFSGGEQNPADKHLQRFPGIPKVYRYTFGKQKESLALIAENEKIPYFFRNPCIVDVTGNYDFIHPCSFEINIRNSVIKNRYVYLCVFGVNGWRPVDWSDVTHQKVSFKNVGSDIIYQLCYFSGEAMYAIDYPFLLKKSGEVYSFEPNFKKTINISLDRKYPPAKHLAKIPYDVKGGKIQASNSSKFDNAIDIYSFDTLPTSKYQTIKTNLKRPYRYYRFLSSINSHINISELELHKEDGNIASGKALGNVIISAYYPTASEDKMFDSDPLTFTYSKETGKYAGIDLGASEYIPEIRFIIRNDDNGIRKDCDYELFYANQNCWKSLGRKIADQDDIIEFDNVPTNAIYWLHNHTKGQEERIFTQMNDSIKWW